MDHKDAEQSHLINGRGADEWLADGGLPLINRVIAAFTSTNPAHHGPAALSPAATSEAPDIRWVVERNLRLCGRALRTGAVEADEADGDAIMASAARRAAEGSSLEALLAAYHLGLGEAWRAIAVQAGPDDVAALGRAASVFFEYLGYVTSLVTRGYQEERERMSNQERDARFALYSALIAGNDPESAARRAGLSLPPRYLVLSVAVGHVDGLDDPELSPAIAHRRRVHRMQRLFEEFADGEVLALLGARGGTVLVPLGARAGALVDAWTPVRELAERLQLAADGEVVVGAAVGPPILAHDRVGVAEDLLELARRLGRGPGVYRLDDLLLEYQVTRSSPAGDAILRLLDPLVGHDELLATLDAFVRSGFDRRATAASLHIHPNTVDYRLGRVTAITGLDIALPHDRDLLTASLTLRALSPRGVTNG